MPTLIQIGLLILVSGFIVWLVNQPFVKIAEEYKKLFATYLLVVLGIVVFVALLVFVLQAFGISTGSLQPIRLW